jgi:hypothetical protein
VGKLEERDYLKNQGVVGRMILNGSSRSGTRSMDNKFGSR